MEKETYKEIELRSEEVQEVMNRVLTVTATCTESG